MQRKVGVVGVIAVVLAILWASGLGRDTSSKQASSTDRDRAAASKAASVGMVPRAKIDPRTQPKGSIAGTIVDAKGAPVPGATVCLELFSSALPPETWPHPVCKPVDAQGAYVYTELYAAAYRLGAGAPRFRPDIFRAAKGDSTFRLRAGEARTNVNVTLFPGGVEITGVVNDLTGGPIAHARVNGTTGQWGQGTRSPDVETDDAGAFSLWMPPGAARITASADGYAPSDATARAPGSVELFLSPASTLSGIVIDAKTGAPIEGVDVRVEKSDSGDGVSGLHVARTSAKGEFKSDNLSPGRYAAHVQGEHGYGRSVGSTLVGLGQSVDGVIVKVWPASRVIAKVMTGDGKTVCLDSTLALRDHTRDIWISTAADEDGTIVIEGVRPGTYQPTPSCPGFNAKEDYPPLVVEAKDLAGLTFEVEAAATIVGRVTTTSGAVVADAALSARTVETSAKQKESWHQETTRADGTYEFTSLRSLTYKLDVTSDAGLGAKDGYRVEPKIGTTLTKDIVLEDGGMLVGTVVDGDGKPVTNVTVMLFSTGETTSWDDGSGSRTDASGAFTVTAIRAGDYRVTASKGGWWNSMRKPGTTDDDTQGERVTIAVGKTATVKLVVEVQTGTIQGTVVDAAGAPVSDAFLSAARESDAAGANRSAAGSTRDFWGAGDKPPVLTATDGTFAVTELSPGRYTLRAYRKGGGEAVAEHVAVGTRTAKLQIRETGSIAGVVTATGAPLPDEVKVSVADLKTGFERTESFYRTDGAFAIKDLPSGHFKLTATAQAGQGTSEVDLAAGEQRTGVTVALQSLLTLTGRIVDMQTKQPVPSISMFAQLAQGNSFTISWDEDPDKTTDAAGKFTIKRAPKGKIAVIGMPKDRDTSLYTWLRVVRDVSAATSTTFDLGDIAMLKKRIKDGETAGELGLNFKQMPEDLEPEAFRIEVSFIDPKGPAARSEIKVGDVITAVDGIDVSGSNGVNAWTLMNAPVGTTLALGLARGATVSVTLAAPK